MGCASALAAIGVVFVNQDERMTRFMLDHQFKAVIVPRVLTAGLGRTPAGNIRRL